MQLANSRITAFGMDEYKLTLALNCKLTLVNYGFVHFCDVHSTIVDIDHIENCPCISN